MEVSEKTREESGIGSKRENINMCKWVHAFVYKSNDKQSSCWDLMIYVKKKTQHFCSSAKDPVCIKRNSIFLQAEGGCHLLLLLTS